VGWMVRGRGGRIDWCGHPGRQLRNKHSIERRVHESTSHERAPFAIVPARIAVQLS
jgi:hypothetical protein